MNNFFLQSKVIYKSQQQLQWNRDYYWVCGSFIRHLLFELYPALFLMNGVFVGIECAINLRHAGQFFHKHVISCRTWLPQMSSAFTTSA